VNPTVKSLMNHVSVRKYADRPVEPDTLSTLLEAGIRAPSAGNLQNYSLMVVDDREVMGQLAEKAGAPFLDKAPLCIISLVDHYRFKRLCGLNEAPFPFDTADAVFIGMWDAIAALHNISVAAEGLGLGTCYIGFILETDNRRILGLPDHVFAAGMMSVGYPEGRPALRTRLPLEAVVHRNTYRIPTDAELAAGYGNWMSKWDAFYEQLPEDKKKHWMDELGVRNNVQYITKTVYTRERMEEWGRLVLGNVRGAGYRI
jgi:FMN reductase (NADPH)